MGQIYATLELINSWELESARRGLVDQDEIKRMQVEMLVDTGSVNMCINETICSLLQLPIVGKRKGTLADGTIVECAVAGPIEVHFKNRTCNISATVLPGDTECLLGAIPLEEMDIMIDPRRRELIVNPEHPEYAIYNLRSIFPYKE
jgi:clan AA aspartic protease